MKLAINVNDIPTTVPVVEPGVYDCTIDKVDLQAAEGKRKEQYSFELSIVTEGPQKGRKLFDGFPTEFLQNLESPATVKLGNLIRSSGYVPEVPGEIDLEALKGKTVRVSVTHRPYTANDGTAQVAANIKEYIAPTANPTAG